MTRVGFIGIGTMGRPMAANLVRKGFAVTLHTGFALGLLAKDVRIAADLGDALALELPMFRLARERFASARDREGPASDSSRAFVAVGVDAKSRREK